jgi:2-polyprenyl-6-methoxyphenol hydroxylase-like FAD-dependent oxidoreductase
VAADRRTASRAPVAIVGAGPVGLALALGLARCGVRSVLLEKKAATSEHSKAPAIHIRTREVLKLWGVEDAFLAAGILKPTLILHSPDTGRPPLATLDFSELEAETDRPGLLVLEQAHTERLLLEAVRESGLCDVRFSTEAVGLAQTCDVVTLTVGDAGGKRDLDAEFVVGCDGASSFVRDALGLSFEGITYSVRPMLADVRIEDERDELQWPRTSNGSDGLTAGIRLSPGLWRLIRLERSEPRHGEEVGDAEIRARVEEVLGTGPFDVVWASRFRIHRRASARFRVGRVLLAGDAAHVHSPAGGLGMNGGIQDAHNLAWKLAYALEGADTDRLLDSYEVERRAVMVESVSRHADRITRVFLDSPAFIRGSAFALLRLLLRSRHIRRRSLRRTAMLDLDYPASRLLDASLRAAGKRLPNALLRTSEGREVRLYDLIPNAPVLIELGPPRDGGLKLPVDRVIRIGDGAYSEPAELLRGLLGAESGWLFVRPEAHIAWVAQRPEGMYEAAWQALGA